jgi:tetratricopeptide (TPR) repeat protein
MYALFRLLAGGKHYVGLFAAALYGLHPALADTLDYTLQRGDVMAGVGITAGLVLWIVWPRRLPADLRLMAFVRQVPTTFRELLEIRVARFASDAYKQILRLPLPLYIIPVVFSLLAHPASAVFALILLVYMRLYEPEQRLSRMLPVTAICVAYWILQAFLTRQYGVPSQIPVGAWLYTQPWIAMRYLGAFFAPLNLSADWNLRPLTNAWAPEALAGYAGVAALAALAVAAGRRAQWRAVSFGIWWFLIMLLPTALIPQPAVMADERMYLPFAGLALATTSLAFRVFERLRESPRMGVPVRFAAPVLAAALLPFLAWATWERNQTWRSDESMWEDVIARNPGNGHALMNYGLILISENDAPLGEDYINRAAALLPRDAPIEVHLAQLAARKGLEEKAENHFRRAIVFNPEYAPAYSWYSQWLLSRQRSSEAFDNALKAAKIDPGDLVARHTLMDVYADRSDWPHLLQIANEALRIDPNDPDGLRGLRVAQTAVDEVRRVESAVKTDPNPNSYLSLSVVYFRNGRYEDSMAAIREALKLRPDLPEAYVNMASVYHVMGKDDDAIAALRETLRLRPDFKIAKDNLAWELAQKKESNK